MKTLDLIDIIKAEKTMRAIKIISFDKTDIPDKIPAKLWKQKQRHL